MALPSMVGCLRCGSAEPEHLLVVADAPNPGNFSTNDIFPICKKCRKALRRWLRRPHSR